MIYKISLTSLREIIISDSINQSKENKTVCEFYKYLIPVHEQLILENKAIVTDDLSLVNSIKEITGMNYEHKKKLSDDVFEFVELIFKKFNLENPGKSILLYKKALN